MANLSLNLIVHPHCKEMNRLLLLLVALFLVDEKSLAQCDTTFPLSVTLRIEKEYYLKFLKSHYSYELARGEYVIGTDSVKEEQYDIEVVLKNNSKKQIFIWLMTCSWEDNFQINNNYIRQHGISCDKNFPELVQFNPAESKIYKITLSKSIKFENPCKNCIYGPQIATTKLGLIVIDDVYKPKLKAFMGYTLAMEDKKCLENYLEQISLFLWNKTETSSL